MSAPPSYEQLTANFSWSVAERQLGYRPGEPINIGWMCSDRICQLGMSRKLALLWEDYQGNQKRFTYDDVRTLSNTVAHFLTLQEILPGERVCLFMDRVPDLYIGFLGILQVAYSRLSRTIKDHQEHGHSVGLCFEE
jgi:acetyl-CoA synthetase